MAYNDVYTGLSGAVTLASTTETVVCSVFGTAAKRLWVVGVRVKVKATTAAGGFDVRFRLVRPANTPNGTLGGGNPHDFSSPASIGQFATAYTTAPTVGTVVAEWEVAQAAGSMWVEYPPTTYEWGVPAIANNNANAGLHLFATLGVATSTPVAADIIWGE